MNRFFRVVGLLAGLVISPALSQAQTTPAAYTGPRYPGGPDSLRALMYRSARLFGAGQTGLAVVRVELKDGREPMNLKVWGTNPPELMQNKATQGALSYLQTRMLPWEPGTPDPDAKPGRVPRTFVALDFSLPLAAQPYAYADTDPGFPDFAALLRAQRNVYLERALAMPSILANLTSPKKGLSTYMQMQTKYPAEALRAHQQGAVYVYFEVAPSGAIEHAQIISSAGETLDAEVLRVVKTLPAATVPAMLRGQPVRIFYVLPMTFKIQ
ncbi:energy transducer TonB [Hymenobacter convexus]|uniref:energy transducer TonB n=1 Tax=Hymenobacter sp. CA1UV-4 TaxID=3063782 RepID=UPI00271319A2|nr:energy transducer TonB [Hymenobacter sp. CA1UV-4]MDO7854473.1 energy transducer TonB [Hymenobacter sp. CA1UV-4]